MTYFLVNSITGEATSSAPTRAGIERIRNYSDAFWRKKGPEWVICEFSDALGINLLNFKQFPKSMIWDGVTIYARGAAS